ncbi:MAG: LamG domain-containing protein [Planctomycetes bacterium]|nr:LamG domain-containing protein [Planctomycetota bacterium]
MTRTRVAGILVLSVTALAAFRSLAAQDGGSVVGLYHFDEGRGGWAKDSSPAENNGFLGRQIAPDAGDPKWVANGKQGGALEFDGVDDVVTIPNTASLCLREGIEVEMWVLQKKRTPYARILDKRPCFDMYIDESGLPTFRFRCGEAYGIKGEKPVPLNEWARLRAVCDGKTMSIFLNGENIGSRPYTDPIPNGPNESMGTLRIGNASFARAFCGLIDEVKITNIGYRPPAAKAFESDADTAGLWHLDDGKATGAGPNRLDGTLHGATSVPGKIGTALRFDGKSCVEIPDHPSLDLQDELTIDCWVKQLKRSPYARIVEKSEWTYGLWINSDGAADFFYRSSAGGSNHVVSVVKMPLNRWTHIRAEFDGFEAVLTFDGKEVARETIPEQKQRIATSDGSLFLGNNAGGARGFIGLIDEVRISKTIRRARPPMQTRITSYPSKDTWTLRIDARGTRGRAATVRGEVLGKDNQPVHTIAPLKLQRGVGQVAVDVDAFPPATYRIALTALDANGQQVAEETIEFAKPPKPPWLGAGIGVSNKVLPPWTPMTTYFTKGGYLRIRCWGREYDFDRLLLPCQIRSAHAYVLAKPIRLVIRSGGGDLPPGKNTFSDPVAAKHEVRLAGSAALGAITVETKVTVEYDGMTRFDMRLTPSQDVDVESAYIEIPIRAEHATLMHHPGRWFDDPTCAGALPKDGWRAPNTWYLWLGDEERGLCWFAEDQEAWGLDKEKPGIEVVRDGDVVRLRVYLINANTKLAKPREFTWGLMATPVKPRPKGWQRWRFGSPGGPVTIGVRWSTLKTSKWHSFPVPPNPAGYHADVKKAHDEGKKFVPYTNFNMQSDAGPEWAYWGEDWNAYAGEGKAADVLAMNVINVRCCAMTPSWCDFIAWKYKTFLEDFDSDGFYLDNSSPGKCNNPDHPAEHHGRRHIFAARELMKRFYTVTKQNDPENVMVCHMSSTLCIPLLSFCDAIVDGEQYGWALKESFDGHYIPITPLARVRAELMAHQWGLVPFYLPCNRGPNRWTPKLMREMLALFLPHGMRFWMAGDVKTMTKVLDVIDAFDLPSATFIPYWSVPEWKKMAEEDGMVVSAYVRDGQAMLIVSNLREEPREARVNLPLNALGLSKMPAHVSDPLDAEAASVSEARLVLNVDGRNLRIIVLK